MVTSASTIDADGNRGQHPSDGGRGLGKGSYRKPFDQYPENTRREERERDGNGERQSCVQSHDCEDGAQHQCVAMGKIHGPRRRPHDVEAQRN
jgi:hypothetical protein